MKKDIRLMRYLILSTAISSFSLILLAFCNELTFEELSETGFQRVPIALIALIFWLFLILAYYLLFQISKHRKQYVKTNPKARKALTQKRIGALTFFSNPAAKLADVIAAVTFVYFLITLFVPNVPAVLSFIGIALFAFAIQMHGVFNGINYKYTVFISKSMERGEKL